MQFPSASKAVCRKGKKEIYEKTTLQGMVTLHKRKKKMSKWKTTPQGIVTPKTKRRCQKRKLPICIEGGC